MKAILVIDMPTDCIHCKLCLSVEFEGYVCGATSEPIHSIVCPLKPMPKRAFIDQGVPFNEGWNACLDEILGETE